MSRERTGLTRRSLLNKGVAVSSAALLAGCLGDDEAPPDDEIHITQQVEPEHNYDPIISNDAYTARIINHIYDGLYEMDEGLTLQPKLAEGEPEVSDDGLEYTVNIVDDAEFHNGDQVTAEDVLHTFIAPIVEQTDNLPDVNMINPEESEAVDDTTVRFVLDEPYGPFETVTLGRNIVNKQARLDAMGLSEDEWWERDWASESEDDEEALLSETSEYNTENPIGSGPYQYVEHTDGEYTDIERWDDYWGDLEPNIAEARWTATEDGPARTSQIRAGDTDFITGVPPDDWEVLQDDDEVDLHSTLSASYFYMAYNCNEGPTAEPDVRRGVEHAFSMSAFVEEIIGPAGENMVAPVSHTLLEDWDLPVDEYADMENEYDPERAAELIEPHIDGTWEPTIIAPPDNIRQQLAERVASRLNELNDHGVDIDAQPQNLDWAQFTSAAYSGDEDQFSMYTLGWTGGSDPDVYMWPLFHESGEGLTQGHYYDDQEFHDILEQTRTSVDQDERRDLYDEAIRHVLEQKIHTPAYALSNSIAAQPYVEDLEVHPDSAIKPRLVSDYNNVSLE